VVSFLDTFIVLTTNAGSEIYRNIAHYEADDTGSGAKLKRYDALIRDSLSQTTGQNRFPRELLGRINSIVPFQPLSLETQRKIVRSKLLSLAREVFVKHSVKTTISPKVLQYLIDDRGDTDTDAGGARRAVAKLTDDVTTAIAAFINAHPDTRVIDVEVVGELVSDNKDLLTSDAHIEVRARI
jgi:ATP-dependent Clp protease ATP-binding subunit ClpA